MEWIKIDKDNLPEGMVLAACFDIDSRFYKEKMFGRVSEYNGRFYCNLDGTMRVTHYIDIDKFDL